MSTILDKILAELESAKKAASLENASFGFDTDRIEIKNVHFGDARRGNIGDVLHPTEYVRNITKLHHGSWIIAPINNAINLLQLQADTLNELEKLVKALDVDAIQNVISKAKSNIDA